MSVETLAFHITQADHAAEREAFGSGMDVFDSIGSGPDDGRPLIAGNNGASA